MNFNDKYTFPTSKNNDVLLVGEVLMDVIHDSKTNTTREVVGGSPYNIAKNLTKLGTNNKFYGAVGTDDYGTKILLDVKRNKVNSDINKTKKSSSYVRLNQTTDTPRPEFYRESDYCINLDENLNNDILTSKFLHFTYWPLSKEPSLSTIVSLVKKAPECNTLIGFDPNYHILLDDDNKGLELVKSLINKVDIIKPSLDDSKRLFGKKSITEYLDNYESLGAKLIIMTLGKDGLIARLNKETLRLPSLAMEVVDSTGAGDAFWSGLYTGLTTNMTIRESIDLGLLCSAENLKSIGSDVDLSKIAKKL